MTHTNPWFLGAVALGCFAFGTPVFADLSVGNHALQNVTRVSRYEFDYRYTATVTNTGGETVKGVTAVASSTQPHMKVIESDVVFGDVAGGATATSSDTFTVRHDRRQGFAREALQWSVVHGLAKPLPPDPGEAGKATIAGIDSDNDGVRDDVQRWIGLHAYKSASGHAGLTQYAKAMQVFLLAEDKASIIEAGHKLFDARQCVYFVRSGNNDAREALAYVRAEYLNTVERSLKYLNADSALSGQVFESRMDEWPEKCDFDPWAMNT